MNNDEFIAYLFLLNSGYNARDLIWEPNGTQTFPDFSFNKAIAIEVTRISERVNFGTQDVSCENISHPIFASIQNLIAMSSATCLNVAAWIDIDINSTEALEKNRNKIRLSSRAGEFITTSLRNYFHAPSLEEEVKYSMQKDDGTIIISINLIRRNECSYSTAEIGSINFNLGDGWVFPMLKWSIGHALQNKTAKLRDCKQKYEQYWLILMDHLTYATYDFAQDPIDTDLSPWSRIILVNPIEANSGKEITQIFRSS